MEPKYINYSWYEYPRFCPPNADDYLCVVLVPIGCGSGKKQQQVIHYEPGLSRWKCDWGIVTHWMLPIAMP